jgi:K+-sensing histidine kinase KdpD
MTGTQAHAPNILVVDDTPANLQLLCGMLKERGYRPRPVPSGALALRAAASEAPDLVLLDISMPEMDGFEVCSRLKADPTHQDVPVIFLTAHTDSADKVKAFAVGGVDYVTKPFQFDEVHARISTHLKLRQNQLELQQSYDRLFNLEKVRDDLVHMIVHDLRSPLTVLVNQLLAAKDEVKDAQIQDDLGACIDAVMSMNSMVTSVLDVSRMEASTMVLKREKCELATLVNAVVREMKGLVGERELVIEAPSPVPMVADKSVITRVIQNLLGNALKFTGPRGQIRIELTMNEGTTRFAVSDDGPGVAKDMQEKIFEKFGQVECYSSNERHSTGLGLTFCKLAVETHGGRIGVDCIDGQCGSTFWFTLPPLAE